VTGARLVLVLVLAAFYVPLLVLAVWVWAVGRRTARFQDGTRYVLTLFTALLVDTAAGAAPSLVDDGQRQRLIEELESIVPRPRSSPDHPTSDERWRP
jgi:hypothetical protein